MSDKQKKGIFYDAAQTVEDMRTAANVLSIRPIWTIPSGKSSAGGRSMTIFPAARKNPMHPSFMRWYAD